MDVESAGPAPHVRNLMSLLASMLHTRLALAKTDIDAHLRATLSALCAAFAALVLALVALTFAGVAIVVVFWDSHRIAAAASITLVYFSLAALLGGAAMARWNSRPPALAATLQELELDREALRSRP